MTFFISKTNAKEKDLTANNKYRSQWCPFLSFFSGITWFYLKVECWMQDYKVKNLCKMSMQSHHLISKQQDCLEAELAGAKVKEILQTRTQKLHHHHIVITFCSTPLYRWNAHCKNICRNNNNGKEKHKNIYKNTSWWCGSLAEDQAEGRELSEVE